MPKYLATLLGQSENSKELEKALASLISLLEDTFHCGQESHTWIM